MRSLIPYLLICIGMVVFACSSEDKPPEFVELNLLEHGLPFSIMAPDSADVRSRDLLMMKDVTIKHPEQNYAIQILASDMTSRDVAKLKNEQLESIKNHPFFSEIVEERDNGFVYKTQIDSTAINYGFRYIHLQGDKEYLFQTGILGTFSLDEVNRMYNAVKQTSE